VRGVVESIYEHDPLTPRPDEEHMFFENEDLTQPKTVVGIFLQEPQFRHFGSVEDYDNYSPEVRDYRAKFWRSMHSRIQSLTLCSVEIETEISPKHCFGVLQVDCPKNGQFRDSNASNDSLKDATEQMIRCTADALGAVVSVAFYVQWRCYETLALDEQKRLLEERLHNLTGLNSDLQTELDDRVSELQDLTGRLTSRADVIQLISDRLEKLHEEIVDLAERIEMPTFEKKTNKAAILDLFKKTLKSSADQVREIET